MDIERRVGRFILTTKFIEEEYENAIQILSQCVVMRCEQIWHADSFDYVAISKCFRSVSKGEVIPFYVWEYRHGDGWNPVEVKSAGGNGGY